MDIADVMLSFTEDHLIGLWPLIAGIAITVALILAVGFGLRRRAREPGPPAPEEQPLRPENPMGYESGLRESDELERDRARTLPHELHGRGTKTSRPAKDGKPPTWDRGGSSHGTG